MYRTTGLALASYLLARGHPLTGHHRVNTRQVEWTFRAEARTDVERYYAGAHAEARGFANTLRDLKGGLVRRLF